MTDEESRETLYLTLDVMAHGLCTMHGSVGQRRDTDLLFSRSKRMILSAAHRVAGNRRVIGSAELLMAWGTLLERWKLRKARRERHFSVFAHRAFPASPGWDEGVD